MDDMYLLEDEENLSCVRFSDKFVKRLEKAKRLVVMTGSMMSAESGLPMYRGSEGMWKHYRAEDLSNLDAFRRMPDVVWEWYNWRRGLLANVTPNEGHYALVRLEELFEQFILITQCGDDLHRVAGNKNIMEISGNIWQMRCFKDGTVRENREVPLREIPPKCPDCGSIERPHDLWFGDLIDDAVLDIVWDKCKNTDIFIASGTYGGMQPLAGMSGTAQSNGAFVLDINVEVTPLYYTADHRITMPCATVLPEIVKLVESLRR